MALEVALTLHQKIQLFFVGDEAIHEQAFNAFHVFFLEIFGQLAMLHPGEDSDMFADVVLANFDLFPLVADEALEAPEVEGDTFDEGLFEVVGRAGGSEDAAAVFEPLVLDLDVTQDGGFRVEAELGSVEAGDGVAFGRFQAGWFGMMRG